MEKIGLIDVDGHNFPNLAQMKISAYHKQRGDEVEWWIGLKQYDIVYQSKVFDDLYSKDNEFCIMADEVIKGGTGYGLDNKLPDEIEHMYPDYSLYEIEDTAYGFLTRGCPRACDFCIVAQKEGRKSTQVADLDEFWRGQKEIVLLDPNLLACKDREKLLKQLADSKAAVDFNQGIDARMLTKGTIELLNEVKTKNIHFAWDFMDQSEKVLKGLELYSKYGAKKGGGVYVLTNFDTTHEEDMYRVMKLKELGFKPYVMIYNKPTAPAITRKLQSWVNNRIAFNVCEFEDFSVANRRKNRKANGKEPT